MAVASPPQAGCAVGLWVACQFDIMVIGDIEGSSILPEVEGPSLFDTDGHAVRQGKPLE